MKIHRVFLLIAAIWELLRFCAVFLAVWIVFRRVLETGSQGTYWLLVLGNGGLLAAAALLFLFVDPPRFRALLNLVRLGKILGLASALLLILLEPVGTGLRFLTVGVPPLWFAPFSLLLVVSVADVIFLFLLFSYRIDRSAPASPSEKRDEQDPPLPEYSETIIRKSLQHHHGKD
jgi:hypothetical protein